MPLGEILYVYMKIVLPKSDGGAGVVLSSLIYAPGVYRRAPVEMNIKKVSF